MTQPNIARRCSNCGATIRQQAVFCSQCGNELDQVGADQRVSPAAEGSEVEEGSRVQRGGKLRQVSSIVIDHAAYDPSLRFVLVAGVLFIGFLLILLFSKLIG